jgi:hypothetical protein
MPEHYRAFVIVLFLASLVFAMIKPSATALAITNSVFIRRRNYWFCITIAGFLSPNIWICFALIGFLARKAAKHEDNVVALYFFMLLALPRTRVNIPGFGLVEYLIGFDYVKVLSVTILLPLCIKIYKETGSKRTRFLAPDIILLTYCIWVGVLRFNYDSWTGVIRTLTNSFLDIGLPYYAVSRAVKTISAFRDVLMSFVIGALIAAVAGVFEFSKSWLIYSTLADHWGVRPDSFYLLRADLLRANVTSGHALAFGYMLSVSIGAYIFLKFSILSKVQWFGGLLVLLVGSVSHLSKGPWVGAAAMSLVIMMLSPERISHFIKLLLAMPICVIALLGTDIGAKIMGFLPFVGAVDEGSATYRQQLFDTSVQIILDNPFFGSSDYLLHMENMRQGEGIIDLVNTYLVVSLNYGLVGLLLYLSFFTIITWNVIKKKAVFDAYSEIVQLGNCLVGITVGILIMISTMSPIFHIALIYYSFAALGVAYVRMIASSSWKSNAAF